MTEDRYRKSVSACVNVALGVASVQSVVSVCMLAVLALVWWVPIIGCLWLAVTLFVIGCTVFWWRKYRQMIEKLGGK